MKGHEPIASAGHIPASRRGFLGGVTRAATGGAAVIAGLRTTGLVNAHASGSEIISELEGIPRGAYCGSIGYLAFDGTADWNLLIRTFVASGGGLSFSVGGGITAASDPAAEYDETLHKAEGMIRVLDAVRGRASVPPQEAAT